VSILYRWGASAGKCALSSTFPAAQHLRCFLHFQDNLQRKLRELGLPSAVAMEIVKDVMGSPGQHQRGLVDTANEDQLDGMLSKFESRWNNHTTPLLASMHGS